MFHIYTYGKQSVQFMILTPPQAALINKFTDAFYEAQKEFKRLNGRPWAVDDLIWFDEKYWTREDNKAHGHLVRFVNRQHAIRNKIFHLLRIDVSKEEIDDYLVKRF